jgi:hypothetical protein
MAVMAKDRKSAGERGKPGRPPTGIETDSFCCRAPLKLIEAYGLLALARGSKRPGTELLNAAESHLLRMYVIIKGDPQTRLLDPAHRKAFLEAAEHFFEEAGIDPARKHD